MNMEIDLMWNAVRGNDARFDGAFVYGVRSTGIYCRPSCSSKQPNRENVEFFGACSDAESCGFRPCKRCRPASQEPSPKAAKMIAAARVLEEDETATLESVADSVGMTPAAFQKLFKEFVGVSPRKYAEAKRLERFRDGVRSGASVTDAMYDAGFNSSRGLYENVASKLGMTPRTYASGGRSETIEYAITDCSLGKLLAARTVKGVCSVTFGDDAEELSAALRDEFPKAEIVEAESGLAETVAAIIDHLEGRSKTLELPLDLRATAFQLRVWTELQKIPYGETLSYQQVAERLGNRNAVRAVARACATNRIALAIPCHRVVRAGGELSGYRWGVERKRTIIENEARRRQS